MKAAVLKNTKIKNENSLSISLKFLATPLLLTAIVVAFIFRYDYSNGGKDERTDRWLGVKEIACEGGYMPLQDCFKKMEKIHGK